MCFLYTRCFKNAQNRPFSCVFVYTTCFKNTQIRPFSCVLVYTRCLKRPTSSSFFQFFCLSFPVFFSFFVCRLSFFQFFCVVPVFRLCHSQFISVFPFLDNERNQTFLKHVHSDIDDFGRILSFLDVLKNDLPNKTLIA